jgi:hypothetical protein
MSDKLTLEQAQTLIGAEVAFLVRGNEVERGIVREAGPDGDGDLCLKLTSGPSSSRCSPARRAKAGAS